MPNQPPDTQSAPAASDSSKSGKPKSKYVNVYNNTVGILDCNIKLGKTDHGRVLRRVKFLPANNKVLRTDLEACMENKTFAGWTKERDATTLSGEQYRFTMLRIGHQKDHSAETAKMDEKIKRAREALVAMG